MFYTKSWKPPLRTVRGQVVVQGSSGSGLCHKQHLAKSDEVDVRFDVLWLSPSNSCTWAFISIHALSRVRIYADPLWTPWYLARVVSYISWCPWRYCARHRPHGSCTFALQFKHSAPDSRHEQPCFSSRFFKWFFVWQNLLKSNRGSDVKIAGTYCPMTIQGAASQNARTEARANVSLPKSNRHLCQK